MDAAALIGSAGRRRRRSRVDPRTVIDGAVRLGDIGIVVASGLAAGRWRFADADTPDVTVAALMVGVLLAATVLPLFGLYRFDRLPRMTFQLPRLLAGWTITIGGVLAVLFALKSADLLSRLWVASWLVTGAAGFVAARILTKRALRRAQARGRLRHKIVLVGEPALVRACAMRLNTLRPEIRISATLLLDPLDDARRGAGAADAAPLLAQDARPLRSLADLPAAVRAAGADQVVLALPLERTGLIRELVQRLKHLPLEVGLFPQGQGTGLPLFGLTQLGDAPLLRLMERPLDGWRYVMKGLEDRVLAAFLLALTAPLLLLLAALVKASSPGPVFYRQPRHGFDREPIAVLKFRTMFTELCDAPDAPVVRQVTARDPRVTPLGRFLRRTSLDELPQLVNVLLGEMSLVGPRPHAVQHDDYYSELIDDYLARHRVKPGMTGWAQIHGLRGPTRTLDAMRRRIELDLHYIDNWSLLMDVRILWRTVFVGFRNGDA